MLEKDEKDEDKEEEKVDLNASSRSLRQPKEGEKDPILSLSESSLAYSMVHAPKLFEKISVDKIESISKKVQKRDVDETMCVVCGEKLSFFPKFRKVCKFCNKKVCHGHSQRKWKNETNFFHRICDICLNKQLKKKIEEIFNSNKMSLEKTITNMDKELTKLQLDLAMKAEVLKNFTSDVENYFSEKKLLL